MKDQALVDKMKRMLPPLFLATQIDDLTQGIILWRTLQNLRSLDCTASVGIGQTLYFLMDC